MTEQFRRDLHAALDRVAGPVPPHDRLFAFLRSDSGRSRFLRPAGHWVVGGLTAAAMAGVLTLAVVLGSSRHPTGGSTPGVAATTTSSTATSTTSTTTAPVTSSATPGSASPTPSHHSVAVATGSPTATPAATPSCTAAEVQVAITTDQGNYQAGQTVHLTLTARNATSHACAVPGTFTVSVLDSTGRQVFWVSAANSEASGYVWASGAVLTETMPWNQQECMSTCSQRQQVPAGTYTAKGMWEQYGPASHNFTIIGSSSTTTTTTSAHTLP